MAILSNVSSYQRYIERINEYRALKSKDQRYSDIQARTEVLQSELMSRNDREVYFYLLIGICFLSLFIGVFCIYLTHHFIGLILVVAPFVGWYAYNSSMKGEIQVQKELFDRNKSDVQEKILAKVQYLIQGVHIKLTRMNIVRFVYMSLFPFIMLGILLIVKSKIEINFLLLLFIALIMGTLFWYFYFKNEVDEMIYQKRELEEYESALVLESSAKIVELI